MENIKSEWVLITGAGGFLGSYLARHYHDKGYGVIGVGRDPERLSEKLGFIDVTCRWDELSDLVSVHGIIPRLIINLAGENISSGRWTSAKKANILKSRTDSGRLISEFISGLPEPVTLIQASAIGYYGYVTNTGVEESGKMGKGFLAEVTRQWEESVTTENARIIFMRLGVIMGNGGAFRKMTSTLRFGFIAIPGKGSQNTSWIHIADIAGAIDHIHTRESIAGPVNMVAPDPTPISGILSAIASRHGFVLRIRIPSFIFRIGLGQMALETILADQRVYPGKLLGTGFRFSYHELAVAIAKSDL